MSKKSHTHIIKEGRGGNGLHWTTLLWLKSSVKVVPVDFAIASVNE